MGKHRSPEEWIKLFNMYETNKTVFWNTYFEELSTSTKMTYSSKKHSRHRFMEKYRNYKKFGITIITSMSGKGTNNGKGKPKKEKEISWDDFTREELIEIAKRYKEITKDKPKSEKTKEGKSLSISKRKSAWLLNVSVSGLYTKTLHDDTSKRNPWIEFMIFTIFYANFGRLGRERINKELEFFNIFINERTVGRYMNALGLVCPTRKAKKKRESKNTDVDFPDLLQRNYKLINSLATDVNYIPIDSEITNHAYLSIAISHEFKEIVSWNLEESNDTSTVVKHFENMNLDGWIVHSDHGSQYSSDEFIALSRELNFRISMSRVGNSLDNREAGYFFANLKSECLNHLNTSKMKIDELRKIIADYICWYNHSRRQSILEWKTPVQARMSK